MLEPRLPRGEQVLAPVLDPLHRRPDQRRREHQAHLVPLDQDLLPEATAGVAHHDPDVVLGHPEQARTEQPHVVRRLRGRVDREIARRARVVDDQGACFDRRRGAGLLIDRRGRHVRGRSEHVVERGLGQPRELADDVRTVLLVDEHGCVLGLGVVDDCRQRFVVDLDQIGGVLRERAARGDHKRDGVTDETNLALGKRRAWCLGAQRSDRRVPLLLDPGVQIGRGVHRVHAGQRERGGRRRCLGSRPGRGDCARSTRAAVPGSEMSSTYVPRPVSNRVSSMRLTRVPTYLAAPPTSCCVTAIALRSARSQASFADQPPSIGITAPETYEARSEARNAATSATSSGCPPRLSAAFSSMPGMFSPPALIAV